VLLQLLHFSYFLSSIAAIDPTERERQVRMNRNKGKPLRSTQFNKKKNKQFLKKKPSPK